MCDKCEDKSFWGMCPDDFIKLPPLQRIKHVILHDHVMHAIIAVFLIFIVFNWYMKP